MATPYSSEFPLQFWKQQYWMSISPNCSSLKFGGPDTYFLAIKHEPPAFALVLQLLKTVLWIITKQSCSISMAPPGVVHWQSLNAHPDKNFDGWLLINCPPIGVFGT